LTVGAQHTALLISDWGGVTIEMERVEAVVGAAPNLEGIRLREGRLVPLDALFTSPRTRMASPKRAGFLRSFQYPEPRFSAFF